MAAPIRKLDADPTRTLSRLATAGELAAGVVHETRNVLTAILGFAQLGRRRPTDPVALARYLSLIEREALRSLALLDRYLGLAAPASDAILRFDVGALIEEVAAMFAQQLDGVTIAIDVVPDLIAVGRPSELEQVLINLVLNASHAMPDGGRVHLGAARRDGAIEIAVADDGPGVPVELRARIFEPFFTTRGAGTGLGLAVCVRMLEEVGGSIALDDAPAGARFVVRLPAGDAS